MAEINQEEMQQELFLEFAGAAAKQERFIPPSKVNKPILLNTSVEHIILVSITLILVCCFVFFLGVLRGKSIGQSTIAPVPVNKTAAPVVAVKPAQAVSVSNVTPVRPIAPSIHQTDNLAQTQAASVALKPYTIQVSTYRKQDLAEKEAATLRSNGYAASVISDDNFAAVCIGQYATKDDAKRDLKTIGAKFKGCFLRRHKI